MLYIPISKSISLFEIIMAAINVRHKLARRRQKAKAKTKHKFWISPLYVECSLLGAYNSTFLLARENDCFTFSKHTRMSPERFDHLLSLVQPKIEKECKIHLPISAEEWLAAALQYLSSGDSK